MPHGISHYLGLDVHDVSGVGLVPKQLVAGNVVTCEPGLYFIKPLIVEAAGNSETVSSGTAELLKCEFMETDKNCVT
jgi:hypothetical protein